MNETTQALSPARNEHDETVSGQSDAPSRENLIAALRTVYDPEIPVNIYDLGLIYALEIDPPGRVAIGMTLTAPGCPVAGEMPGWVEAAALKVDGVKTVKVNLVFDPPWTPARMSDEAKLELNML